MEPVKKLPDSEMKLMELIWDSEPVRSGELVSMSLEKHGWKKSTVYSPGWIPTRIRSSVI